MAEIIANEPAATAQSAAAAAPQSGKGHSRTTLPTNETELIDLGRSVVEQWKQHPDIKLPFITGEQLGTLVTDLSQTVAARNSSKGQRSVAADELGVINEEINTSIKYVKGYLAEAYSAESAPSYYSSFGIIRHGRGYGLPRESSKREVALGQLAEAVGASPFTDRKYGKLYWQDMLARYVTAKQSAAAADTGAATAIGTKREQLSRLRRTLRGIVLLLKAGYPDTWPDELRKWGFRKERY